MLDSVRCSAPARDKDVDLGNYLTGPRSGQLPRQDRDTLSIVFLSSDTGDIVSRQEI